jgi:hypothetical protein
VSALIKIIAAWLVVFWMLLAVLVYTIWEGYWIVALITVGIIAFSMYALIRGLREHEN